MHDYFAHATVQKDIPDSRDWIYRPSLAGLKPGMDPPFDLYLLDQRSEGSCTGFALAAAINLLNRYAERNVFVSARMLYEMAKHHDEWEGEAYSGSSLRGAIHGWKNMGVCREDLWQYHVNPAKRGDLTVDRAKDARSMTLGAYYRLLPVISDYHSALNEAGVIVVSAKIHEGWKNPVDGCIEFHESEGKAHAFAVVGYNERGFWIQNSWGTDWGKDGIALWAYEDWIAHVMDGWVFRLALPTPQIFGMAPASATPYDILAGSAAGGRPAEPSSTRRDRIAGHFAHFEEGRFASKDRYWSTPFDVAQTAELVFGSDKYDHLLFFIHGGMGSSNETADRIAAMKPVFKENRIYPYHILSSPALIETLGDILKKKGEDVSSRLGNRDDAFNRVFETTSRMVGRLFWDRLDQDAHRAFSKRGAATGMFKTFLAPLQAIAEPRRKKIHVVCHSTGAGWFARFFRTFRDTEVSIETCCLLAPACSVRRYHETYFPSLQGNTPVKLRRMHLFTLCDGLEQDDSVISKSVYRSSLLYLVSNALARHCGEALVGMEKYGDLVRRVDERPVVHISDGVSGEMTRSKTHEGFLTDPFTMNSLLTIILDGSPRRRFRAEELNY